MNELTAENHKRLAARLNACVALLMSTLTGDSVEHVCHYIKHGELEMAYESLVLSCIKEGVAREKHISDEFLAIGIELKMESESVFEADFWRIAQEFFSSDPPSDPPPQGARDKSGG